MSDITPKVLHYIDAMNHRLSKLADEKGAIFLFSSVAITTVKFMIYRRRNNRYGVHGGVEVVVPISNLTVAFVEALESDLEAVVRSIQLISTYDLCDFLKGQYSKRALSVRGFEHDE